MKLSTSLLIALLSSFTAFAQIVDKTEQKAIDKTNNRIDRRIDQGLDKGLNAVEGLFSKKKKKPDTESKNETTTDTNTKPIDTQENGSASSDNTENTNLFSGTVDVDGGYSFDHNMMLNVQSWNKKGKEQDAMDIKMFFSEDEHTFGMEIMTNGSKTIMVYDMKSSKMVTLMDNEGQKMGIAMKFNPEKFQKEIDQAETYGFEKTGKSKVISGYNCEEYIMTSSEDDQDWDYNYWLTNDIDANWMQYMSSMMSANKKMASAYQTPENYPKGSMIQTIGDSRKNDEKVIMTVKEINKNQNKTISTEGYQFMNLPSFGGN